MRYHAETGDYDVEVELDQRTALRTDGRRKSYRYQVQGPNAMKVIEKALGETPPGLKFFNMATVTDRRARPSARCVTAWPASPAGSCSGRGTSAKRCTRRSSSAGEEFGLVLVGGRAYGSNALESGWIPSPLPAVYSGESLKAYREWLPASGYEGTASLGGSFASPNIEDYYFTPVGPRLRTSRQVRSRLHRAGSAREDGRGRAPDRRSRSRSTTTTWTRTIGTMLRKTDRAKYIEWPNSVYSMHPFDRVTVDDETVGLSTWVGYSANEGKMLTLAVVDSEHAEPGTEVIFVWGEEDGGSAKPTVERHVQTEIRAVVSPVPYVETVRRSYAPSGWRVTDV